MTSASIKIQYWAEGNEAGGLRDLEGIAEFREELDQHYVSVVHGRPGDLGGLHELAVEIVSNLTLQDVVTFILSGMAYDAIKSGTKSFILRPFLAAYRQLRDRNPGLRVDIEQLSIIFQDSNLIIYKITDDSICVSLEGILKLVAKNYAAMRLPSNEAPFQIHIPVLEDPTGDRLSRFRVILDIDETVDASNADYLRLWGLRYDYANLDRVFDVERRLLIDSEFLTRERYEQAWQDRYHRRV